MLKGTIAFRAGIRGNGITFPKFAFNPNESGVDQIEMEGPNGNEVSCIVHLASVATSEQGKAIATRLSTAALNRVAVFHSVAIGPAQITDAQFSPLAPTPGVLSAECGELVITGEAAKCSIGIPAAEIRAELEQVSPSGESYFGLYRSARQSASRVEEFMHLYHVLLMLFGDSQTLGKVEALQRRLITDRLRSYSAAHRAVMPSVVHSTRQYENNRAEVSHQPTRHREGQMHRFKSAAHAQRFLSVHGIVRNLFHVGRHLLRAAHHRMLRTRSFCVWHEVTCGC